MTFSVTEFIVNREEENDHIQEINFCLKYLMKNYFSLIIYHNYIINITIIIMS